jgi:sugar phosphate isomerase/epimerase
MTRYGVDLITFYDPTFWGVETFEDVMEIRRRDPRRIWESIFEGLSAAGIELMETTFGPTHRESALEAYGSAEKLREAAAAHGLGFTSVFHLGLDWVGGGRSVEQIVEDAVVDARFAREAGADTLVVGPPMRSSWDDPARRFVDLDFIREFADVAHRVGAATLELGVRTAIHTEAHSVFSTPRDVDAVLGALDPYYVFFCPDTAHLTLAGGDPVQVVGRHAERVALAHWKDATGPMTPYLPIDGDVHLAHREYMTPLGTGVVDWEGFADVYAKSLAPEVRLLELDAVPDPVTAMIQGREFIEARVPGPVAARS